ncbi:NAD-dependent epimerase/dehydratase family protein [Pontibacter qinzhouensis]|uniref:NAD-dependent epimerase/dehydratase family protein n=1 Tax=Pontibacter qinzhouensis TaxID=2603253 RepID=A0A5C8K990_9BACT|nr:NAD-dependent epimerase/dehydratase family protein [Pontibacter qinzhouensis]TXK45351.1 NAD-dependent epimerase/dehydratase family protein [Pontibacter qinzhouensis]
MAYRREMILVIGACGQLGSELTLTLRTLYGADQVVAADIFEPKQADLLASGPFEKIDVLDPKGMTALAARYNFTQIYHLAAVLSATGEKDPKFAWRLNMDGLFHVLDLALACGVSQVFWPSSIAVFGPDTPRQQTPQHTVMNPSTVYGISKQAGEQWCAYYFKKHGLDIRSLRYPGLIGYKSLPGGGTTDYAVDIYRKAAAGKPFECYLHQDTYLPMMYMPDAIKATIDLMQAPARNISIRESYNVSGMSFSPSEIAASIQKILPSFEIAYNPDYRQQIADSWPQTISDQVARQDWGWQPAYDLDAMTADMLENLQQQLPFEA